MSRGLIRDDVTDNAGNAIQGAQATIYIAGTLTKATLYDQSVGGVVVNNPITTDVNGVFQAFAEAGEYDITVTTPAGSTSVSNVTAIDGDDIASIEDNLAATQAQIDALEALNKTFIQPDAVVATAGQTEFPFIEISSDQTEDTVVVFVNGARVKSGFSVSTGLITFDAGQSDGAEVAPLIPYTNPIGTTTAGAVTDTTRGQSVQSTIDNSVQAVDTLAELEVLPFFNGAHARINLGGRAGPFRYSTADLSTEVAADPQQGIYVAPASDPTGSSGAWVRQYGQAADSQPEVRASWFNLLADDASDDATAIQSAIDSGAGTILLPKGNIVFKSSIYLGLDQTLKGAGRGNTILKFRPLSASVAIRNKVTVGRYTRTEALTLDSDSADNYAFQFTTTYGNAVNNIYLTGSWDIGILTHDSYVDQFTDIDTTGTPFKRFGIAISSASNATTVYKFHTSSLPTDAATPHVGIAVEGGKGHALTDCLLQGQTIGIYLAEAIGATITNPYFENTVCNIKTGDNTRGSNSDATTIIGGVYSSPYASHPHYAARGPIIFTPRSNNVTFVNLGISETGDSASVTGPYPILTATTTSKINIQNSRHFLSTSRNLVMKQEAGASPSITMTGSSYGASGGQEIILKTDGAFGGQSAGIRVDSAGVVTADVFTPPTVAGTVDALLLSAMPSISSLVMP